MTLSIYDISIPVLIRGLNNLSVILTKGAESADARKIDPSVLINARLAPDMLPLSKQIQIASDISKGGAARLAGVEIPSFSDSETTFAELQARITKTIQFLESITPEQVKDSAAKTINLKVGGNELTFSGKDYLLGFVMPNLYFHTTVAYAILRHNGVELGKSLYLGAIS